MRLYLRILSASVLCTAGALTLLALLLTGLFGRTLGELRLQRLAVMAEDRREALESSLAWGIPLAGLNLGGSAGEPSPAGPGTADGVVLDRSGRFISPGGRSSAEAAPDLKAHSAALLQSPAGRKAVLEPDRMIAGAAIRTPYGSPVGSVLFLQDRSGIQRAEVDFIVPLLRLFGLIFLAAVAVQAIVVGLLLRPLLARLGRVADLGAELVGKPSERKSSPADDEDPILAKFTEAYREAKAAAASPIRSRA